MPMIAIDFNGFIYQQIFIDSYSKVDIDLFNELKRHEISPDSYI